MSLRTPQYATGSYPVPQVGSGQHGHPITLNEIPVPDGQAIIDVERKTFTEIKPDVSLELRDASMRVSFDLLVELDLTERPSYNREKFLAYDAFLCGWSLAHPRFKAQGSRPIVAFVCRTSRAALTCALEADALMSGRIGAMGIPPEHWYYAGRDHLFVAVEGDMHHGEPVGLALPAEPPALRERLAGSRELTLERVDLLSSRDSSPAETVSRNSRRPLA